MSTPHATFTVERRLAAPRARAFAAWQGASLANWYVHDGQASECINEFRVGGLQRIVFGPPGGPVFRGEARYEDIAPDERIVTAGSMYRDAVCCSSTLCTIEFFDADEGSRIVLTDQTAYYVGDYSQSRREGWEKILGWLEAYLQGAA